MKCGNISEALDAYSKAIEFNPDDPAPYEKMFLIYKEVDQPTEAVKAALTCSRISSKKRRYPKSH